MTSAPARSSEPVQGDGHDTNPPFTHHSEHAAIAAIVVTFANERDIAQLLHSLRLETQDQSIKVIVADNSPSEATLKVLDGEPDVLLQPKEIAVTQAASTRRSGVGTADAYLILNPDLRVQRGSIKALRDRMAHEGAGVVVPTLLDGDGSTYRSLRREPTVSRAIGDALMGSKIPGRPGWLSEMVHDVDSYRRPHQVDWATGAALLIRSDVAETVGTWDERFFLYSEETDYMRRVRSRWFCHLVRAGGQDGPLPRRFRKLAPALEALMSANRIRYVRKFHNAGYARAFRAAVVISALLRVPLPGRGKIFGLIARESRWGELPHAAAHPSRQVSPDEIPSGAVIIPAHNEVAVLRRTLEALDVPLTSGRVEVIVACNGCSDGTEEVARSVPGVRMIEVAEASKVAALNAGDRAANKWPRVYLDADIELPVEALSATLAALSTHPELMCARPAFHYDTDGASWPVRAYYRARNRLPQASASMWGAGVYGLSRQGHQRLGEFPAVTNDDCFIDRLFESTEKATLDCLPVTVRTPRSTTALLSTLKRVYRGNRGTESLGRFAYTQNSAGTPGLRAHDPISAIDALVYAALVVAGRWPHLRGRRRGGGWERDDSSRNQGDGRAEVVATGLQRTFALAPTLPVTGTFPLSSAPHPQIRRSRTLSELQPHWAGED